MKRKLYPEDTRAIFLPSDDENEMIYTSLTLREFVRGLRGLVALKHFPASCRKLLQWDDICEVPPPDIQYYLASASWLTIAKETLMRQLGTPNVRFWMPYGQQSKPVRFTMKPGQVVTVVSYSQTEEGYDSSQDIYEYDATTLTIHWHQLMAAQDCDGRLDHTAHFVCPISELATGNEDYDQEFWEDQIITYPAWQHSSSSVRDHSAEAAGY